MKDQLRGCVRISAEGKELYRFINSIHHKRISCRSQRCRKDVFSADIYRRDLREVRLLAEEYGISLDCSEYTTLSSFLLRYRRRFGLLIGAVIVIASALYFSGRVMTIEIQGNSAVSSSDIIAALDELGIKRGADISKLDFHWCENELRVRVEGISWASIRRTGNRIVVEVTEVVRPPEAPKMRVPCNIVSTKKAKITSFTVQDGFLMHKIGDYVAEGTLLVSGVSTSTSGGIMLHHSMGSIIGAYDEQVTFTGSFTPIRTVRTGREKNERSLRLFSLDIPLYIGKNKFTSFDTETSESPVVLFGKELPISLERRRYTETTLTGTTLTEQQLEDELNKKIFIYEKNFIGEDTKILSRSIEKNVTPEGMTLTVNYSLEGDIGREKELLIKN